TAARRAGVRFRRQQGDGAAGRGGHAHRVLSRRGLARIGSMEITGRTRTGQGLVTPGGSRTVARQSGLQLSGGGGSPSGLSPLLVYQPDSGHRSGLFSPERPAIVEYRYSKTNSPGDRSTPHLSGFTRTRYFECWRKGRGRLAYSQ